MSGKIDLIIEANMKPWDYMAHVPLIEEVGGLITDWSGKSLNIHSDGKVIASKSKLSYHQAMKYLKEIG
jgi:myo-inositol-1(or 4)-monophosphatase